MNLRNINDLITAGDYSKALEVINGDQNLDTLILKCRILTMKGSWEEALQLSEIILSESQKSGTDVQKIQATISRGYTLTVYNDLDGLKEIIESGENQFTKIRFSTEPEKFSCRRDLDFINGQYYFYLGESEKSLDFFQKSLEIDEKDGNNHQLTESLLWVGWTLIVHFDKNDEALSYFRRALTLSEKSGNKFQTASALDRIVTYYNAIHNIEKALENSHKSIDLFKELNHLPNLSRLYTNTSLLYRQKDEFSLCFEYINKAIEISKELNMKTTLAFAYMNRGFTYADLGELDNALKNYISSLEIRRGLGHKTHLIFTLKHIGFLYFKKGDLEESLQYLNECHKYYEQQGVHNLEYAQNLGMMSMVYIQKGELDLATKYLEEGNSIFNSLKNEGGISWVTLQKGRIEKIKGNSSIALENFEKALEQTKEAYKDSTYSISYQVAILTEMILLTQDIQDIKKAEYYYGLINKFNDSKLSEVKQFIKFSEAIIYKMSKRGSKKFRAQQLFQEIIADEIINFSLTILAMFNLCELLLLDLSISEDEEELLNEITILVAKIRDTAEKQGSDSQLVMALLLNSQLLLIKGDLVNANVDIQKAKSIANEKKLGSMIIRLNQEEKLLETELNKWEILTNKEMSVKEKVIQARLDSYIIDAKKLQENMINTSFINE